MKAAVLHGIKDLRVEEIDMPEFGEHEVLIKVEATGICGSDFSRVLGDASHYYPNVLGHEFSGVVVDMGSNSSKLKIGDKVSVAPLKPCHICHDCLSGNHALCKNYSFIGSREFGAWAEYMIAPSQNVVKLPDSIDFLQGAFLEPLTVALHGLFVGDFKPLKSVAITGMGTIGLLTLQCALAMGAKDITVFDIDDEKLKIARLLGATHGINTMKDDLSDALESIDKPRGFDIVVETAGVSMTTLMCLEIAANNGHVIYIGTPHNSFEISQKQFEYINRKELTIKGSWMSYSAPFPGKEWHIGGELLASGKINVDCLVDRIVSLEEFPKAFEDIEKGNVSGKIIARL